MKTLPELLREADPIGYEAPRSAEERRRHRERVVHSPWAAEELQRRRIVTAAVVGLALIGVAGGFGYWSRVAVEAVAAVRFEVRLAEESPAPGLREAVISGSARRIYLHQETIVTNGDIAQARAIQSAASTFGVTITFNADGAAKMLRASRDHIGRPVAILVDGDVVLAPVVRGPISTSAIISGSYTKAEAERIAAGIVGR
jgi:hypothetical protein